LVCSDELLQEQSPEQVAGHAPCRPS
jgi:hypothetical protein